MLDEFAEAKPLATSIQPLAPLAGQQEIERLQQLIASQDDRKTLLSYQLEEFAALNVAEGELMTLETEHKRLAQAQNIQAQLAH